MKVSINTKSQTVTIHSSFKYEELEQFLINFPQLKDYTFDLKEEERKVVVIVDKERPITNPFRPHYDLPLPPTFSPYKPSFDPPYKITCGDCGVVVR